ncbi:hypothetical protein ElyMa_005390400 [Elysia marginata]|uniref:CTNNB1 binding N-teminal domain-containing protein n=1 Tax=Elysia marginata TaxID=1093978 RepID=A0AAV4EGE7_9GAST|nr:hypothetical protein ElyMa_005390400 [Elysia marginata]
MRTQGNSEDKEVEQSETIDSFDKSSDCSSRKEKPNDLGTGVDGNKQYHVGSQDFEVTSRFDEDQESDDVLKRELPYDHREAPEHLSR